MALGEKTIPAERLKALWEAIDLIEQYLNGQKYVAGGDSPTLADLFLWTTIATLLVIFIELNISYVCSYFILFVAF